MKNTLSLLAFLGALTVLIVGSFNVQRLPEDVLNALLGISVGLLVLILVILPWIASHTKPSLSEAGGL